jgi:hypothetical protein
MGLKRHLCESLNTLLKHFGLQIVESRLLYEWQTNPQILPKGTPSLLPEEAPGYLVQGNPRLRALQARYSGFNYEVTTPFVWTESCVNPDEMLYFRGDNAYVWQQKGLNMNALAYALTTYYVMSIDEFGLLDKLKEDAFFGAYCFNIGNRLVSRDLLDAIIEIYFLEEHLKISAFKDLAILDIGAGYGRLAHRMVNAFPNVAQYLCTDAFAISSFICEYYLRYRDLEGKAKAVPLDEIEHVLRNRNVDIAINIHSFSECKISAIEWWLSLLEKYRVKYLMIVPNPPELRTNEGIDFGNIIEKHGYKMIAKDPKYRDPLVQKYAVNPSYHYLFELQVK